MMGKSRLFYVEKLIKAKKGGEIELGEKVRLACDVDADLAAIWSFNHDQTGNRG